MKGATSIFNIAPIPNHNTKLQFKVPDESVAVLLCSAVRDYLVTSFAFLSKNPVADLRQFQGYNKETAFLTI